MIVTLYFTMHINARNEEKTFALNYLIVLHQVIKSTRMQSVTENDRTSVDKKGTDFKEKEDHELHRI